MRDDRNASPNGRPAVNGVPSLGGTFARTLPTGDDPDAPIDLVAVQADDELVSAIGTRAGAPAGERPAPAAGVPRGTDDRLVQMLAAWRAEIDAEPIPELVDLDAAVAAVLSGIEAHELAGRRRRAGRMRHLAPLAAAAAIIVATVTGVGLGSQDAMPGDTLWAVQKVVNPERAESVEAKVAVEGHLEKVRVALQKGDTVTAAQELETIRTQIPDVRGQEGQPALMQEQEFLAAKLADTPPGTPANLSTPAKSNPAARPTAVAPAPPAPDVPPPGKPVVTAPSGSQAPSAPGSTEPDVRDHPVDPAIVPDKPEGPRGGAEPVPPVPDRPAPQVTKEPEATAPVKPAPPDNTEGGSDVPTAPKPAPEPPPPSHSGDGGAAPGDGDATPTSDTTSASGSAGASVETTATDHTTS